MRVIIAAATLALALASSPARAEVCRASFYGSGARTANGERFVPSGLTAAHRSPPFGTRLRVTYGGRSVEVRVNDRGPFIRNRCLDLSTGAARAIGLTQAGVAAVTIERL
jgi:rare lipoprotein A